MAKQKLLFDERAVAPTGEGLIKVLRKKMAVCKDCHRSEHRTNVVVGEGNANSPTILFLGESPTIQDDYEGRPLSGPNREMLSKWVSYINVPQTQVFFSLIVACGAPHFDRPDVQALVECKKHSDAQIKAVNPKVLITLGSMVTASLINVHQEMMRTRGKWYEWEGIKLRPMYHPSYLMDPKNSVYKKETVEDLLAIREYLDTLNVFHDSAPG